MTFWCQYEFCELDTRISISGYLKIDLAFSLQCHVKCGVSSVFFFFFFSPAKNSVLEFGLLEIYSCSFHFYLSFHVLKLQVIPYYFDFFGFCFLDK